DIPKEEMASILRLIGFTVEGGDVTVPSWRSDVAHYSDLAEEVARFHGYNKIPTTLMRGDTTLGGFSPKEEMERSLGALCRSMGYSEIITYSFISPTYYDKIRLPQDSPLRASMKIMNPLGEDTSIMRTTVLPSMLEILARNYNFRNKSVRLYELGRTYFLKEDGLADEPKVLSLGAYGGMDFFALKGAVEAVLSSLRIGNASYEAVSDNPSYHPGRCAKVLLGDRVLGIFGQVHPLVCRNYGVDEDLYCAELAFDALWAKRGPEAQYAPLPRFPSMARDIAVVCDSAITVATLEDCIRRGAKGLIKGIELFDIYTGAPIPAGKKSAAFNLTLRADDRSLTAAEADEDVKSVLALLEKELGAVLR
ncbi:MAG TPA: phenylalanine--tRNA ligase subunit beta, partial [Pseudoflavonifractor sp.]|nr:phenylalanine--tRNA ligase subunit beta [Pseudoflavonifractor sp.]